MAVLPHRIRQSWILPKGLDTLKGVSFVLEPQCVLYALDIQIVPSTGIITKDWSTRVLCTELLTAR